jgi:glucosylceramidase
MFRTEKASVARRRSAGWIAVLASACALAGPACALAGPARAAGAQPQSAALSAAEREAVALRSVVVSDDPSLGLIATVTFAGDVARYLGQGGLRGGGIALVLTPRSGPRTGVLTEGGGFAAVPLAPVIRHGLLDVLGPERVLPFSVVGPVAVVRGGDRVVFQLPGVTVSQGTRLTIEVFAHAIPGSPRRLTAGAWGRLLRGHPDRAASVVVSSAAPTTQRLETLGSELSGVVSRLQQVRRSDALVHRRLLATGQAAPRELMQSASAVKHLTASITELDVRGAEVATLLAATRTPTVNVAQTDPGLEQAMASESSLAMSSLRPAGVQIVTVNAAIRYQHFAGVGAAMTDSAAWLIEDELSSPARQALLQELFGAPGATGPLGIPDIHLNFLRVAIGASGAMTLGPPNSYDDTAEPDPSLQNFSIAPDVPDVIPALQQALAVDPALGVLASLWSPPAWMKSNDSLDNPSGTGTLLPSDYGPLAAYIVRFIEAYAGAGIPIDALTPANEPSSGDVATDYPGLTLPESDEAQFINQDLAPALSAAGLSSKIYGGDLAWSSLPYAAGLVAGPAAQDLAGIAWHCYFGSPTAMSALAQVAPALDQIVDECSPEIRQFGTPEFLISSLRNWASTVAVWTLALDQSDGPIQPGNDCQGCTGPVTIDEQTGAATLRPEYYELGQVSAFVQPGAWRIASPNFVQYGVNAASIETVSAGLDDVAFQNPDGSEVLVAYDNSARPVSFAVAANGDYFTYTIPARAMTTFSWPGPRAYALSNGG